MKKTILAVAVAVFMASGSAFAVNYGVPGTSGNNGVGGPPIGNGGNGGAGGAGGNANQGQLQGQLQAQGQMQGQSSYNSNKASSSSRSSASAIGVGTGIASSYSGGNVTNTGVGVDASHQSSQSNNQSVVVTDSGQIRYSGSYDVKTTGVAPDILTQPTAPCRIAVGVSGGWLGGALGIGGSVEDTGCTRRENARVLAGLNRGEAAVKLMCNDPEVAAVLPECAAPAPAPAATAAQQDKVAGNYPTNRIGGGGFVH